MADVKYRIGKVVVRPLECMQSIVAICLLALGLFLLSSFYVPSPQFVQAASVSTNVLLREGLFSLFFIVPALSTVAGWFSSRFRTSAWRARGCFIMFTAILFVTLLRIFIVGLTPPIWIFYLGLGFVSAVCYLHWKVN